MNKDILLNHIKNGQYFKEEEKDKVNTLWLEGELTDADRQYYNDMIDKYVDADYQPTPTIEDKIKQVVAMADITTMAVMDRLSDAGTDISIKEQAWQANKFYIAGDTTVDQEKKYECIQSHQSQEGWEQHLTPALWKLIPETGEDGYVDYVPPTGAHDAYNTGDKVIFEGKKYICKMDGCTWSPAEYPAAWEEVIEEEMGTLI